ncbi:hypothetical protein AMTRI_Chr10g5410 [Amborella trichopoda]
MRKYKLALALILFQSFFAVMIVLTKVAFLLGMSFHSLSLNIILGIMQENQTSLSLKTVTHIFVIGQLGVPLLQISYFYGVSYTSSTFTVVIIIRNARGQAKIVGTVTCVGGATIMTLINRPTLGFLDFLKKPTPLSHLLDTTPGITPKDNWTLGPILIILAVISYGAWLLYQAWAFKDYPAQAALMVMMLGMGTLQSAILALIINKSDAWTVNSNFELFTYAYSGIWGAGLSLFLLSWSLKEKGPVYTAAFAPLSTVLVAILEPITLHVDLHIESMVGMVVVFSRPYIVLWGRAKDDHGKQKIRFSFSSLKIPKIRASEKIGNKFDIGNTRPTTLQVQQHKN